MNSASYEYRDMSPRRMAHFVPIGMPTICWKTFPPKTTKILSTRNKFILKLSSSVYMLSGKGRDLTQSYDKSPYIDRKIQKNNVTTPKKATKNFDCTTIADRLRTVRWGNDSHPTGVFKPVYGIPTYPLTAKAV